MLKLRHNLPPVSSTTILVRISEIRQVNTLQQIAGHPCCNAKLPTTAPPAFHRTQSSLQHKGPANKGPPESCQTRFLFGTENPTSHFLLCRLSFCSQLPLLVLKSSPDVSTHASKTHCFFLVAFLERLHCPQGLLRNVWQLLVPPFQASYDDLVSARYLQLHGRIDLLHLTHGILQDNATRANRVAAAERELGKVHHGSGM